MLTCQDWLRNGSVHSVTLGCTVKEQVQCIHSSYPHHYLLCISHRYLSCRQLQYKFSGVFQKQLEVNGYSVRVIKILLLCCLFKGRTFPSGPCAAGFVCVGGASEPSPLDSLSGFLCPPGFFCPVGTSVPKPCPKGTFRCLSCNICLHFISNLLNYSPSCL